MSTFGTILRHLRDSKGWTQRQLSQECGLVDITISRLERDDQQPSFETVQALARALGVGVEVFAPPTNTVD